MITFAIILGILFLILCLRLSLVVRYDAAGFLVQARIGPVRAIVYPLKERSEAQKEKDKAKKAEKKRKKQERLEREKDEPRETGGSVEKLKAGLSIVGPILRQVRRRLIIRELCLHYTAAMPDAAMTALAYGGAHAAVSALLPMIRHNFTVKKQDIQIHADFERTENLVVLRVQVSISVWGALCLGLFALWKVIQSGLLTKSKVKVS